MVATCKFCQALITPAAILKLPPKILAKVPPDQQVLMRFTSAVTQHIHDAHPEYMERVQQLAGNFTGHCILSTVDPVGEGAYYFRAMSAADSDYLRVFWEAMPNPPHPDILAQLADETRIAMDIARKEDGTPPPDCGNLLTVG